ncbi:nSTAND3 domain-containing NTPase [Streptomyces sp. NPDC004051]
MLGDEFGKVRKLVKRGLCESYVLLTNARVTGSSEEAIRAQLLACGVKHPLVLDGQWISDTIAANRELRMFVPRVYGLGDLSQILDDRAYVQASVLAFSARDQISTFVVTDAYRKAAEALNDKGFVLLLGEPAVGKSSIALMLAISAADNWGCVNVKPRTSEELVQRWNPHEKDQFFWVDDAFGAVRHERHLTDGWARDLPHVMSAVKNGARVVLTSRSYIYNEARPFLKAYAYPLLHEKAVTVDVSSITRQERQQILYNHLSAGDQEPQKLAQMRPYLEGAADANPFRPEAARRLGLKAFTSNLRINKADIETFMSRPHRFLSDVYSQLDVDSQAALALVYVSPEGLLSPLHLDRRKRNVLEQVGSTVGAAGRALTSLVGTFLRSVVDVDGASAWVFQHPTLREGFAAWLIDQPHLLPVILSGMDDETLLNHTHCLTSQDGQENGILLGLPAPLYPDVAKRFARIFDEWPEGSCWTGDTIDYLGRKCSDEMLMTFLSAYPNLPSRLTDLIPCVSDAPEPAVLARLRQKGALPEIYRRRVVENMGDLAVNCLDTSWITEQVWDQILTDSDRADIFRRVRTSLLPRLEEAIRENWTSEWLRSGRVRNPLELSLRTYRFAFEVIGDSVTARFFRDALESFLGDQQVEVSDGQGVLFAAPVVDASNKEHSRSLFSDLGEGV